MLLRRIQNRRWLLLGLAFLTGCGSPAAPVPVPRETTGPAPTVAPTAAPTPLGQLAVSLFYPKADTPVQMGNAVKFIAQVTDDQGAPVNDAQVTITVQDPGGRIIATIPAAAGQDGVYRSDGLPVPHRTPEGIWTASIEARTALAQGHGSGQFSIQNSTSENFLYKYGFWLDAPTLKGVVPGVLAERGDAQNGLIRWGGYIPGDHILAGNIVEVQWRAGDYKLDSAEAVRRFVLEQLGDLGFTPVRDIGPFEPMRFKRWDAWRMGARGQFHYDQMEWVIFYAPEVNKTYAIATTVVLPPAGIDAHTVLRSSFDVAPEIHAQGTAPEPLPRLLTGPELLSPALGARFEGAGQPIILRWKPVKELAQDEYYEVLVEYNFREDTPSIKLVTRDTQVILPEQLYHLPNCNVFNWQVTLKKQTGTDADGQPTGEALSYNSLYWYLQWFYPSGQKQPGVATTAVYIACPNAQY